MKLDKEWADREMAKTQKMFDDLGIIFEILPPIRLSEVNRIPISQIAAELRRRAKIK
jgi:hypothetical protein